jgi:hypothetical protein
MSARPREKAPGAPVSNGSMYAHAVQLRPGVHLPVPASVGVDILGDNTAAAPTDVSFFELDVFYGSPMKDTNRVGDAGGYYLRINIAGLTQGHYVRAAGVIQQRLRDNVAFAATFFAAPGEVQSKDLFHCYDEKLVHFPCPTLQPEPTMWTGSSYLALVPRHLTKGSSLECDSRSTKSRSGNVILPTTLLCLLIMSHFLFPAEQDLATGLSLTATTTSTRTLLS